jgi:hypothetical protein
MPGAEYDRATNLEKCENNESQYLRIMLNLFIGVEANIDNPVSTLTDAFLLIKVYIQTIKSTYFLFK